MEFSHAIGANIERLASSGITNVLLTGAYGEFHSLTDAERLTILQQVRSTGACTSIMACAASLSAEATASLALKMLEAGADYAMVAPPLACETSESDVLRHFAYLAGAVGRQLVVYNNPAFGHDLEPRVIAESLGIWRVGGVHSHGAGSCARWWYAKRYRDLQEWHHNAVHSNAFGR